VSTRAFGCSAVPKAKFGPGRAQRERKAPQVCRDLPGRQSAGRPGDPLPDSIALLQGEWGDDLGLTIKILGREARFSDGSGAWTFTEEDGELVLRGAKLVGTAAAPVWKFPSGLERHWARLVAVGTGDSQWAEAFYRFKDERLGLRRQLREAFAAVDLDRVISLKEAWEQNNAGPLHLPEKQRSALLAGGKFVPGICFRHKAFQYRGVILGCDPWCTYPASWRAKWLPNRPQAEEQAFYHCLVDERDRPGRQSRYVAEENLELCDLVFPVQASLAEHLLVPCVGFGGYLPGSALETALQRQRAGSDFVL